MIQNGIILHFDGLSKTQVIKFATWVDVAVKLSCYGGPLLFIQSPLCAVKQNVR